MHSQSQCHSAFQVTCEYWPELLYGSSQVYWTGTIMVRFRQNLIASATAIPHWQGGKSFEYALLTTSARWVFPQSQKHPPLGGNSSISLVCTRRPTSFLAWVQVADF